MHHEQRIERREFKYFVEPERVSALRRAIAPYTELDPHARTSPDRSYLIESLYLDGPNLPLFWENEHESFRRVKLRVRRYPDSPKSPFFLEVKERFGDMIEKSRVPVTSDDWLRIASGESDPALVKRSNEAGFARFRALSLRYQATPRVLVRYRREPYVSLVDDYVRVTFDRAIVASSSHDYAFGPTPAQAASLDSAVFETGVRSLTLVELKFTRHVPLWLSGIVARLELSRGSCSKYCRAIRATRALPSERRAARGRFH